MLETALEQYRSGRLAEAAQTCQQILQQANHVGALHLVGLIAARQQRFEQAIAIYRRVIDLEPQHLEAHNNLGIALMQLGRLEEAIACYRQALSFAPDRPEVRVNLGNALQNQGDLTRAICCYEQALAHNPNLAAAHKNLAHVLRMQSQLSAAVLHHQRSIALSPNDAEAHFGYAFTLLIGGDLQLGFAEYEWRWRLAYNPTRNFTQPRWDGSPLNGRSILLWAEQGLGDTIQFVRYVPQLAAQGHVIVECQAALRSLLETVPGIDQMIVKGEPLPNFDLQAPLLSLPHLLKTSVETIPATIPYLQANRSIELTGQFKIGIAWAGDPKNPINQRRSCPIEQFLKLRSRACGTVSPSVTLYSLQKDRSVELPEGVVDLSGRLQDFADTAAIVTQLDLVISIDTALAHLAGALGKPVWVVLPFAPDWRWLLDRSDCPWYPTMRLFRQPQPDDWDFVFTEVQAALWQLTQAEPPVRSVESLAIACSAWTEDALNLALQLQRHCPLKLLSPPDLHQIANPLHRWQLANLPTIATADCPVLSVLSEDFTDLAIAAAVKIGWLPFDLTQLSPDCDRLRAYDKLIVPSAATAQLLKAQGIDRVTVIDRGIDPTIFHPVRSRCAERTISKRRRNQFVIFAAGEPSESVLTAFDRFAANHPDALLLTTWPIDSPPPGLHLGKLDSTTLAQVLQTADAMLAIDRPGTRAIAMAALACGLPTIVAAAEPLDWLNETIAFVLPANSRSIAADVVDRLAEIYSNPKSAQQKGAAAADHLQSWTWEQQTLKLFDRLRTILSA